MPADKLYRRVTRQTRHGIRDGGPQGACLRSAVSAISSLSALRSGAGHAGHGLQPSQKEAC